MRRHLRQLSGQWADLVLLFHGESRPTLGPLFSLVFFTFCYVTQSAYYLKSQFTR